MSVVILKWNPGISSWSTQNHINRIIKCNNEDDDVTMNWSIWEHEKVRKGDLCFLLKVGYGANGIVEAGKFIGKPYNSSDWSDENRNDIFYADYKSNIIINHDACPILSSEILEKNIPDFDWRKGHSGAVLTERQAEKFLKLWNIFLEDNAKILITNSEARSCDKLFWNEKDRENARKNLVKNLFEKYGKNGRVSYCSVRMDKGQNTLYYIDSSNAIQEGDYVKVPYGQRNYFKVGIVEKLKAYSKNTVPYPLEKTKCIVEKISNPGNDIIEDLRQPRGDEIISWKDFIAQVENLDEYEICSLVFEADKITYYFSVRKYGEKIFVQFNINGKESDVMLFENIEKLESKMFYGKFNLKEQWQSLKFYDIEWD